MVVKREKTGLTGGLQLMGAKMQQIALWGMGLGLVTTASILGSTVAYAQSSTSNQHFTFASNGLTSNTANFAQGAQMHLTVNVVESNADTQGGESHDHGLPQHINFVFTEGSQSITETGTMIAPGSEAAAMKANMVGQTFQATYNVTAPASLSGNVTVSTESLIMWQPFGSQFGPDTDDPVDGGAHFNCTITPPGGGNLPEVPYAGLIPALLVGGYLVFRFSKRSRVQ
jgi:hypothetical protein